VQVTVIRSHDGILPRPLYRHPRTFAVSMALIVAPLFWKEVVCV
jgi:hypothetical protein